MAQSSYSSGIGLRRYYLRRGLLICLVASTFLESGCLFRTRPLERQYSNAPLKTASQKDLIDYVNGQVQRGGRYLRLGAYEFYIRQDALIDAVTTGPPECRAAAMPAAMSIHCMRMPPKIVP